MRELKFRAWNKLTEQMVTDEFVGIDTDGSIEVGGYSSIDEGGGAIVVMQYTGLKDKNGVEIYEGDILGVPDRQAIGIDGRRHDYPTEVVEWQDFGWMPFTEIDHGGEPTLSDMAVVGNIYEIKELLK